MEYYLTIKKNEILSFAVIWVELEDIILNNKHRKIYFKKHAVTYMWKLRKISS
jgi:hypothetical protein